jgi:thiamine-phosphate pyrophosphorylase
MKGVDEMNRWEERLQLYVVTDARKEVNSLLQAIEEALAGGATAIQLRRKKEDGRELVQMGHAIREMTRRSGALFFVNDRVDIALITDADGVHLGQSDISCLDAKQLLGDKWVGVSAGSVSEAQQAVKDGADYLGVGSVYPTQSKADADLCGVDGLRDIVRQVSGVVPVVAIGGIQSVHVPEVMATGVQGIAVVSAVLSAASPKLEAVRLCSGIRQTLSHR